MNLRAKVKVFHSNENFVKINSSFYRNMKCDCGKEGVLGKAARFDNNFSSNVETFNLQFITFIANSATQISFFFLSNSNEEKPLSKLFEIYFQAT
jgi:hypothetical protein